MGRLASALARGWRSRCPACGRGRLRTGWFTFAHACGDCSHVYLRDPGDWTGAAETAFILTVAFGAAAFFLLAPVAQSPVWRVGGTMGIAVVIFAFLYPRIRGAWIGLISLWDDRSPRPPGVLPFENDPEWEHPEVLSGR